VAHARLIDGIDIVTSSTVHHHERDNGEDPEHQEWCKATAVPAPATTGQWGQVLDPRPSVIDQVSQRAGARFDSSFQ
jgi:hypothetical protein